MALQMLLLFVKNALLKICARIWHISAYDGRLDAKGGAEHIDREYPGG